MRARTHIADLAEAASVYKRFSLSRVDSRGNGDERERAAPRTLVSPHLRLCLPPRNTYAVDKKKTRVFHAPPWPCTPIRLPLPLSGLVPPAASTVRSSARPMRARRAPIQCYRARLGQVRREREAAESSFMEFSSS